MAQRRLLHGGVLVSVGALFALNLPSCSSANPADAPGSAGGSTIPIGEGTAGSSSLPASSAGAAAVAGAAPVVGASGAINSSTGGAPGAAGASVAAGGAAVVCDDKPPNNGDTCSHAVEYNWCTQDWLADSCLKSCKKCTAGTSSGSAGSSGSGMSTGSAGSGSMSGGPTIPPVTGGQSGWASRYWDCCKTSCGWSQTTCGSDGTSSGNGSGSACTGGQAYMCYGFAPWAVSDTLSYGFVAAGGQNYSCGKCYQFTFNGQGDANTASLNGKSMIVQVVNTGNDVDPTQFDLAIPGGGVGVYNACSNQWGKSFDLGAQYGGFATECKNDPTCIKNKCDTIFAGKPDLQAGCSWYLGWYGGADNPKLSYKEIACPQAIKDKSGHG